MLTVNPKILAVMTSMNVPKALILVMLMQSVSMKLEASAASVSLVLKEMDIIVKKNQVNQETPQETPLETPHETPTLTVHLTVIALSLVTSQLAPVTKVI